MPRPQCAWLYSCSCDVYYYRNVTFSVIFLNLPIIWQNCTVADLQYPSPVPSMEPSVLPSSLQSNPLIIVSDIVSSFNDQTNLFRSLSPGRRFAEWNFSFDLSTLINCHVVCRIFRCCLMPPLLSHRPVVVDWLRGQSMEIPVVYIVKEVWLIRTPHQTLSGSWNGQEHIASSRLRCGTERTLTWRGL